MILLKSHTIFNVGKNSIIRSYHILFICDGIMLPQLQKIKTARQTAI